MNSIITKNISEIESLCKKYKVKELYAFGSVTDETKFNEKSDVDLLVDFKDLPVEEYAENYFDLATDFEKIFNREVDLVTIKSLRNPVFIRVLNRTRIPLFSS